MSDMNLGYVNNKVFYVNRLNLILATWALIRIFYVSTTQAVLGCNLYSFQSLIYKSLQVIFFFKS